MLGVALDRVAVASTGASPSSSATAPPWPPPSSLASTIGLAKRCDRCARSSRSLGDDVTAGNLAVGELWPHHRLTAPLLCSCLTGTWGPLTSGSHRSARQNRARRCRSMLRGWSSSTTSPPVVTSSPSDLRDLAHWVSYSVEPLVGAMYSGGAHGGAVALDDGATPVGATAARSNATPSITELRRSYLAPYYGLGWTVATWPQRWG